MTTEKYPEFVTRQYLSDVLAKFEGHDKKLSLVDYSIESGSKKGDNFASCILRVKLKYTIDDDSSVKNVNFIIKTKSESSEVNEILEQSNTFRNEAIIYQKVLEACHKLDPEFKIAPKLIHIDDKAMVLEDLNSLNFELKDRKKRLSSDDTKIVLERLAKFHALTTVAHSKDENLLKFHMESGLDQSDENPIFFFFMIAMQETIETIMTHIPELEDFGKKLQAYDVVEKEKEVFRRGVDEKFFVLNHGDMWINNVLFKSDDKNQTKDAIFVDYQESFFGSPGIDLNHFLYSSCDLEVHDQLDEMIRFYHEHLSMSLKQLNFTSIPTLVDIQHEFDAKIDQALIVLCTIVPVLILENSDYANPEYFLNESEEAARIRREIWANPKFISILKDLVPKLEKRQIFKN